MKNIIRLTLPALIAAFAFACAPQEFDEYGLGTTFTYPDDQFTFNITPATGESEFVYNFEATFGIDPVKYPYTYEIYFGDGSITKDKSGSHKYVVLAGDYTAKCLVYTPDGEIKSKEVVITFANDNPEYFQDDKTSIQFALTGGKDNLNGKIWNMKEGAAGIGPATQTWPEWWQIDAAALFNDEFIFKPNSTKANGDFVYNNNGDTFVNEALASLFADGDPAGSFTTLLYTPATDASWEVISKDGKNYLVLNKAFLGYPVIPGDLQKTEYEITAYSEDEVAFKYYSPDGNAWFFTLAQPEDDEPHVLAGVESKTWEISAAYMSNPDNFGERWWTMDSPALLNDTFTFTKKGKGFTYHNDGDTFMNEELGGLFPDGDLTGSFVTTAYTPATDAKWSLSDTELTLTKAFFGYAVKPSDLDETTYTIVEISDTKLHVVLNTGVAWHFELVPVQ
ncbi:MAG: hypothetical protein LBO74_00730 [Candidatus Symbiothrix sp.]|jgi:hypothetical protein|nr:hypothetical protein [Candidatus Symbiothrix sp.]